MAHTGDIRGTISPFEPMTRSLKHRGGGESDSRQLLIDWSHSPSVKSDETTPAVPAADAVSPEPVPHDTPPALVQVLKWDFRTTFPEPTQEAIDAGIVTDDDLTRENIKGLHDEHAREALAAFRELDAVLDARRTGVDPRTGRAPTSEAANERLRQASAREIDRLQRWWNILMDTYESAFGDDAANAFAKAIRARHAGVEVIAESRPAAEQMTQVATDSASVSSGADSTAHDAKPPATPLTAGVPIAKSDATETQDAEQPKRRRLAAHLPVPRPLPPSVTAGIFGCDEDGPVKPGAAEVRAITEQYAEKLIDLWYGVQQVERWLALPVCSDRARLYHENDLLRERVRTAVARYAEDFGPEAAQQLLSYTMRKASQRIQTGLGRS